MKILFEKQERALAHEELMESEEIKKIAVNLFEGFDESNMAGRWIEFLDIRNIGSPSICAFIQPKKFI